MRLFWRRVRSGALACLLALGAASAHAQIQDIATSGDWTIQFAAIAAGSNYCGAVRYYRPPAALHIDRVSSERRVFITYYGDAAPDLASGSAASIELTFATNDGDLRVAASGVVAKSDRFNGISFGVTEEIMILFRRATTLTVSYRGHRSQALSLAGSTRAIGEVIKCIQERF